MIKNPSEYPLIQMAIQKITKTLLAVLLQNSYHIDSWQRGKKTVCICIKILLHTRY